MLPVEIFSPEPRSLQEISLNVFTGIACNLWDRREHVSDLEARDWMKACEWLQNKVHNLPPRMANQVSTAMILALEEKKHDQQSECSSIIVSDNERMLLTAILHPDMTELDVGPDEVQEFMKYQKFWLTSLLCEYVFSLKKLKIIKLPCACTEVFLKMHKPEVQEILLKELEELTLPLYCTDKLLQNILSANPNLKHLDICRSKSVSDASVENIMQLTKLEHLNIARTCISPDGLSRLIESGLLRSLKYFACSVSFPVQSRLISELANVTTIDFNHFNEIRNEINIALDFNHFSRVVNEVNLTIYADDAQDLANNARSFCLNSSAELSQLTEVRNLLVTNPEMFYFYDNTGVGQLIQGVGSKLVFLDIIFTSTKLFNLVMKYCRSLKCLKLRKMTGPLMFDVREVPFEEPDEIKFESLTNLFLDADQFCYPKCVYALTKCINLEKLCLNTVRTNAQVPGYHLETRLLREVLIGNPLAHLKEVAWAVTADKIPLILRLFPGLTVIRGNGYMWYAGFLR